MINLIIPYLAINRNPLQYSFIHNSSENKIDQAYCNTKSRHVYSGHIIKFSIQ